MKSVFDASNGIEAYMINNLLSLKRWKAGREMEIYK